MQLTLSHTNFTWYKVAAERFHIVYVIDIPQQKNVCTVTGMRPAPWLRPRTQIQLLELATDGRPDGRPLKLLPFDMTVPDR